MNAVTEYDEPGRLRYLAGAVRRARRLRGLSGRELARRDGLSETLVSKSGRYFTVTGRRVDGSPAGLARPDPDTLAAVLRSLGLPGPWTTSFSPPLRGSGLKGEAG